MDDMDEGFLKLTNHREHPTNKAYKVFFFHSEPEAVFFKNKLNALNLYYENDLEETDNGKLYLFGIRKTDVKIVQKLNNETIGEFRKPFIENKFAQITVVSIGFIIVIIAIISYYKNEL